jgi:hypothetical protein
VDGKTGKPTLSMNVTLFFVHPLGKGKAIIYIYIYMTLGQATVIYNSK